MSTGRSTIKADRQDEIWIWIKIEKGMKITLIGLGQSSIFELLKLP
jgi:hypothetical protein